MDEDDLTATDPAVGLAAVAALHRLAERLENVHVDHAREAGWSWAEIAAVLGVSKQAAHQKHQRREE
ncbi:MAG: helix-turn-helix domain-containing protein [Actinomycetales bacterium]|nr:helix-turn-helix domain-containing protein [Actinomycetales bacterium]